MLPLKPFKISGLQMLYHNNGFWENRRVFPKWGACYDAGRHAHPKNAFYPASLYILSVNLIIYIYIEERNPRGKPVVAGFSKILDRNIYIETWRFCDFTTVQYISANIAQLYANILFL